MDRSCFINAIEVITDVIKNMTPVRIDNGKREIYQVKFTQLELNTAVLEYMMENGLIDSNGVWNLNRKIRNKNGEFEFTFVKESD